MTLPGLSRPRLLLALLIGIAVIRIASTHRVFSQTFDEPYQIAGGVEWLDRHTFTIGVEQPPLGRIAIAVGPWLLGARSPRVEEPFEAGNAILYSGGNYWTVLTAARLGNLVFFIGAALFVFLWARRWFDLPTALLAVLIFSCLPPILGHTGVATVDMAQTATLTAAIYFFVRWLEDRTPRRAALAGLMIGLSVLAKFSNLTFFAACLGATALAVVLARKPKLLFVLDRQLAVAAAAAMLTILAGYFFELRPLIAGFHAVFDHAREGHSSFLLGEFRMTGWWHFFPVVLAVKTPLAFLLLALLVPFRRQTSWQRRLTLLLPFAILLSCLPSTINLGVRHILAFYPFFAILAAYAAIQAGKRTRVVAAALVVLGVAESVAAHPDYLASFNLLAGSYPETVLCESDLDWGQDLQRLAIRVRELNVPQLSIAYFGSAAPGEFGLPPLLRLSRTTPTSGYLAVSAHRLILDHARDGSYDWLYRYQPIERIGRSIFLYRIP